MTNSLANMASGAQLAVFTLGVCFPCANSKVSLLKNVFLKS